MACSRCILLVAIGIGVACGGASTVDGGSADFDGGSADFDGGSTEFDGGSTDDAGHALDAGFIDVRFDAGLDAAVAADASVVPTDASFDGGGTTGVVEPRHLVANGDLTCLLRSDGVVRCWGFNRIGAALNVSATLREPTTLALPRPAVTIAMSETYLCAILDDGGVTCAGYTGLDADTGTPPTSVSGLPMPAIAVATGYDHACVVVEDGRVYCWGSNRDGELGFTGPERGTPVLVSGVTDAVSVACGIRHTCVVRRGGSVACFGSNVSGQLGRGTIEDDSFPIPEPVVGLGGVVEVVASFNYNCALDVGGAMWCWGDGASGSLGDGYRLNRGTPVRVVHFDGTASRIHAADHMPCAAVDGDEGWCWGSNWILDDVVVESFRSPTFSPILEVGRGLDHRCILVGVDEVMCSGSNTSGQLGDGSSRLSSAVFVAVADI